MVYCKKKPSAGRIVYEVIERTIDKDGQFLLVPDIECNTIWTNLGWSDDDIIKGYHAHGECEQYHSEIKTDMHIALFREPFLGSKSILIINQAVCRKNR